MNKTIKQNATYVSDFGIRIYAPKEGKKYWRISYTDHEGKLKDTTATSEKNALDKSSIIENILRNDVGNLPHKKISELVEQYVASKTKIHAGGRAEWGKKHASSQKIIFRNQILPEIGNRECLRLTNKDLKKIIEGCETVDLSNHVFSTLSALIRWGCANGWLLQNSEMLLNGLKKMGKLKVKKAGETNLLVGASEIPSHRDVHEVAKQSAVVSNIWWYELMFNLAAYSGLRFGEICDLDIEDIDLKNRKIKVDFQCLSVEGKKSRELPKWDTQRVTVFPEITPNGYKLLENLKKRIKELKALKETPIIQDGTKRKLLFSNQNGGWLCPSSFGSRVRRPAQELAGWKKTEDGDFLWSFHSLRHVFCTYYAFDLNKDIRDVSIAAGHASYLTTIQMYIGNVDGALERLNS